MRKFREILAGGDKGFTLIELLVVIAVLGILAGIAIPRISGITEEAEQSAAKANLRTIQTGLEIYYVSNDNDYPPEATVVTDVENYVNLSDIDLGTGTNDYVYSKGDGSSYDYQVTVTAGGMTFTLTEDGISES